MKVRLAKKIEGFTQILRQPQIFQIFKLSYFQWKFSMSTVTSRRKQSTKLLSKFHFTIMLVLSPLWNWKKCEECLRPINQKSLLTFLSRDTFDFTLTTVPFITPWSVIQCENCAVLGNCCGSRDFRVEIRATCCWLFFGSWSFWDIGVLNHGAGRISAPDFCSFEENRLKSYPCMI